MSWRDQPNASYFSARYAERMRARERATPYKPSPCLRCPEMQAKGSLFCSAHASEYDALIERAKRGEIAFEEAVRFAQRTYWPPV